jgi:hypothetical protein
MSARSFFDTNVLVYADAEAVPAKQKRAVDLVAEYRIMCQSLSRIPFPNPYLVVSSLLPVRLHTSAATSILPAL